MRITKCSVVLLLAVCLSYPAVAAKAKEASGTYQARCIVKIEANPEVYPVFRDTFNGLLYSSRVKGKANQDVLKSKVIKDVELKVLMLSGHRYTFMYNLEVRLPENNPKIEPVAEEYLAAVIVNMKEVLNEIYDKERDMLGGPLQFAEEELNDAMFKLESLTGVSPASKTIEKQLDLTVDVSKLKDDMPLYEALDMLSKSVKPALPVTVMWKDLSENAFIEKEASIRMDGQNLTAVRLGTVLDLVLKSVGGNLVKLGYAIEGGILIIATSEQLPAPVPVESLRLLLVTRNNLAADKANYELQIAEQEAYRLGILKQIAKVREDMQLKVATDGISERLEYITNLRIETLEATKKLMNDGKATKKDVNKAEEDLIRTKIDCAQRRQEVGKEAGGNKINELNDRLGDIAVDVSVRKAMYAVVIKQLNEVDAKLAVINKYASKRDKIEAAKKALKNAENKAEDLRKQIANLKPPVVTVIGAN